MSIEDYVRAKELIAQAGGGDFEGAKPEILVAKAEAALGVRFPPSYRRFLLELGCGHIEGVEVFGLIDDNFEASSIPNGVWLTLSERRAMGLNTAYVIVGESGDGAYYALDTSALDASRENPVVKLSMSGAREEKVADSFGSYLPGAISADILRA